MRLISRAVTLAVTALTLGLSGVSSTLASYPEKPLRLIVPYPAGGPNDVLARLIGQKITELWDKQTIIENRPGAGGNIAIDVTARSAPDGYTAVLPAMAYVANPFLYESVPYQFNDLTPVAMVATGPLVLVVHPSVPAQSVPELIALAKAQPNGLSYASGGNGSSLHLAAELFKLEAGVNLTHVPYRGTNSLIADLLTGRVQAAFMSPLNASEYVKDGRLRALAVTSRERSPGWPDTPTIAEGGVPNYAMEGWYAVLVPAATPDSAVRALNATLREALRSPDVKARLETLGIQPLGGTPEEAASFIAAEARKWEKVIKDANIKAD